jgi:hypothetical protein
MMRVRLPGIIRRWVHLKDGRAPESFRKRRERNLQKAKANAPAAASSFVNPADQDAGDCRCYGCAGRRLAARRNH